jgi:hypothetical protein
VSQANPAGNVNAHHRLAMETLPRNTFRHFVKHPENGSFFAKQAMCVVVTFETSGLRFSGELGPSGC